MSLFCKNPNLQKTPVAKTVQTAPQNAFSKTFSISVLDVLTGRQSHSFQIQTISIGFQVL